MNNLLEAKNLSKFYKEGNEEIKAVNNIDFSIKKNEKIVIYGRSGLLIKALAIATRCFSPPDNWDGK